MDAIKTRMEGVTSASKEMREHVTRGAQGVAMVGAAMAATGALLVAAMGPALAESRELSKAIALVATEADTAVFSQDKMREVAVALATTYGNAPVDQAKAMYRAVALGANDAAKSQAFLTGVNLLAVAGNADLEMSTNALGGTLNAYGEKFDRATDYSDAFFTAMKQGNTTVQALASSVGRVTATAAGLNIPIEEVLGAVSVMTNKGVEAAEAVSGLKEALANVVHPSHDAATEAARLGIKFNQTELRAKGLQGFLKEITTSARFNATSLSKLFTSVEGSNAIMQVAGGQMQAYNSVMDAMAHKQGATAAGFEIMSQTLDFQEKKFESTKKVLLGIIGQTLEPLAAKTIGFANAIMEALTKIPQPILGIIAKVVLVVGAFLSLAGTAIVVVGGILALGAALAGIVAAVPTFIAGAEAVGAALAGVSFALWPVALAIAGLAAAGVAAGALLVLTVVGIRMAWEKNLGGLRDSVVRIKDELTLTFTSLEELFSKGGFTDDTWKKLEEHSGIKNFAISVYLWVNRIQNFLSGLVTGFEDGIGKLGPIWDNLTTAIDKVAAAMGVLLGGENDPVAAGQAFDEFGRKGVSVGESVSRAVGEIVEVVTAVTTAVASMIEGWNGVEDINNGWNNFGGTLRIIVDLVKEIAREIMVVKGAWDSISGAFENPIVAHMKALDLAAGNKSSGTRHALDWGRERAAPTFERTSVGGAAQDTSGWADAGATPPAGWVDRGAAPPTPTNRLNAGGTSATFSSPSGMTMPAMGAAAGAQAPAGGGIESLATHLATIAKNTAQQAVLYGVVMLDGDTLGKFTGKQKKDSDARSFTPGPVET